MTHDPPDFGAGHALHGVAYGPFGADDGPRECCDRDVSGTCREHAFVEWQRSCSPLSFHDWCVERGYVSYGEAS